MIITYHGKQFIKLQQGDFVLAYNPISKDSNLTTKPARFGAQITLISTRYPDFNGYENTKYGDSEPLLIQGPGSYERSGVTVSGFETRTRINGDEYINTVYFLTHEGIRYCFLGALSDHALDQSILEHSEEVDILFVPIGGGDVLSPNHASKIIKMFSPKVIIPLDYGHDRDPDSLELFIKETGSQAESVDKYVFKASDIASANGKLIVLNEQ